MKFEAISILSEFVKAKELAILAGKMPGLMIFVSRLLGRAVESEMHETQSGHHADEALGVAYNLCATADDFADQAVESGILAYMAPCLTLSAAEAKGLYNNRKGKEIKLSTNFLSIIIQASKGKHIPAVKDAPFLVPSMPSSSSHLCCQPKVPRNPQHLVNSLPNPLQLWKKERFIFGFSSVHNSLQRVILQ